VLFVVAISLISGAIENTPSEVWSVTFFSFIVICFGAYLLGHQREATRRRTVELEADQPG
jgi:hypothetical protein